MIFSSAKPENVEAMTRSIGLLEEADPPLLLACWARDKLGLTAAEMARRVETVKDLETVWKKLKLGEHAFSQADTVLIDDAEGKARLQPFNHLYLPPWDPWNNASVREAFEPRFHSPTRRRSSQGSRAPDQSVSADEDAYLLRAIAALDALSRVSDMSSALRAGIVEGLAELDDAASGKDEDILSKMASLSVDQQVDGLWERRGREACNRLGVPVEKRFDPDWAK